MQRIVLTTLVLSIALFAAVMCTPISRADEPLSFQAQATYQGKGVMWWARHAQQARKDANARAVTIRRLRGTLAHDPSVQESIALAHMIYPKFSICRAWAIIKHESWMTSDPLHARNSTAVGGSHATGLYQFLTSTFASTPFGKAGFSIYSPYAQSLAAGWMHQNGRGGEWAIPSCR